MTRTFKHPSNEAEITEQDISVFYIRCPHCKHVLRSSKMGTDFWLATDFKFPIPVICNNCQGLFIIPEIEDDAISS